MKIKNLSDKEWLEEIAKGNTINFKEFMNTLREQDNAKKLQEITNDIDTEAFTMGFATKGEA